MKLRARRFMICETIFCIVKEFIPMYEPLQVSKCEKCGKVTAEPKVLIRIRYGTFLHNSEMSITSVLRWGYIMSRIIRLLRSPRKESLDEELQLKCSKCGNRLATDKDGFCDHCRFDDTLTRMTEKK